MTRNGAVPRLMAHRPEPLLTLNPEDAARLRAGDLVRAETPEGEAVFRLACDSGQSRGVAFAPMHWSAAFAPAAQVNSVVPAAVDPLSGQPELKQAPLRIRPFPAGWHGFLLAKRRLSADLAAWCRLVPLEGSVWQTSLPASRPRTRRSQGCARCSPPMRGPSTRISRPAGTVPPPSEARGSLPRSP